MDWVGPMRVGIHPLSFNVNVSVAVSVSVFTCDIWMTIIQTFSLDSMLGARLNTPVRRNISDVRNTKLSQSNPLDKEGDSWTEHRMECQCSQNQFWFAGVVFFSLFVCVSLSSFEFTVSVLDVVHFIQFECRMWMRMWIVLWNRNVNPVSKSKRGVDWRMSDIGCWMWEDINERPYVFRFCATKNLNSKKPRKKEKSACFLLEWNCCWCWGR